MSRGQWANLARMPRSQPDTLFEKHPGIFNDLGLTSHPKDDAC